MENGASTNDDRPTLDPPGSIAVVGAGPFGVEAALYGRYLGYNVCLIEANGVACSLEDARENAIPILPDRCISPLAKSALAAQNPDAADQRLPLTIGEWIDWVWNPLLETDLLRGRLRCPLAVVSAGFADADDSEHRPTGDGESSTGDVPPDFRLGFGDGTSDDFEAVILATGAGESGISHPFSAETDYWFELHAPDTGDAESDYWDGLKQIVRVFASLGGREDLDLYRPLRGRDE